MCTRTPMSEETTAQRYQVHRSDLRLERSNFSIKVYCSPVLRHSAGLIQAANFRSTVVF